MAIKLKHTLAMFFVAIALAFAGLAAAPSDAHALQEGEGKYSQEKAQGYINDYISQHNGRGYKSVAEIKNAAISDYSKATIIHDTLIKFFLEDQKVKPRIADNRCGPDYIPKIQDIYNWPDVNKKDDKEFSYVKPDSFGPALFTAIYAACLHEVGIDDYITVTSKVLDDLADVPATYNYTWLLVQLDGKWTHIDIAADTTFSEFKILSDTSTEVVVSHLCFALTDKQINLYRPEYSQGSYPSATSAELNYFNTLGDKPFPNISPFFPKPSDSTAPSIWDYWKSLIEQEIVSQKANSVTDFEMNAPYTEAFKYYYEDPDPDNSYLNRYCYFMEQYGQYLIDTGDQYDPSPSFIAMNTGFASLAYMQLAQYLNGKKFDENTGKFSFSNPDAEEVKVEYIPDGNWGKFKISVATKAKDIAGANVDIYPAPGENWTFNGKEHKPEIDAWYGNKPLVEGTDYTVYYHTTHAGEAYVELTGIGAYEGTKRVPLIEGIKQAPLTSPGSDVPAVTANVDKLNLPYTGSAVELNAGQILALNVTYKVSGHALVPNEHYTIRYENNDGPGTGYLILTGKGDYSGEARFAFNIYDARPAPTPDPGGGTTTGGGDQGNQGGNNQGGGDSGNNGNAGNNQSGSSLSTQSSSNPPTVTGKWKKGKNNKWWFAYDAASTQAQGKTYPANDWVRIAGKIYHFDGNGYMLTGWKAPGGQWYYFGGSSDGAMRANKWVKSGSKWYYMGGNGVMLTGEQTIDSVNYLLDYSSGAMKTGWQTVGGVWRYYKGSGAMATGWVKSGGKWYYMNADGSMKTAWHDEGANRYFLNPSSGEMLTGWNKITATQGGGSIRSYYYFSNSGVMQKDRWVGSYWLGNDGKMATDTRVDGGRYYVDINGRWVKGA